MKHTHLTDEQLIATCVAGSVSAPDRHDAGVLCASCEERRATLAGFLEEVSDSATVAAEAAFPLERLARQHARILLRLDQQRVGRILTFPLASSPRVSQHHTRPIRRWVAGAAAAGLLIGMVAGHLVHELPVLGRSSTGQQAVGRQASVPVPLRASTGTMSDDEFMQAVTAAIGSSGPTALRRIDAVTPVAWEVR